MSKNEKVNYISGDISHEQLSPIKKDQTMFTPGKKFSFSGDQNWPQEYDIPLTGVRGLKVERSRVVKLGRGIINDQDLRSPSVLKTRVESYDSSSGGLSGVHTITETNTEKNLASVEKTTGSDIVKEA